MIDADLDPKLADNLGAVAQLIAETVLMCAPDDREAQYAHARAVSYQSAIGAGMSPAEASQACGELEACVRALVTALLSGGAATGGRA